MFRHVLLATSATLILIVSSGCASSSPTGSPSPVPPTAQAGRPSAGSPEASATSSAATSPTAAPSIAAPGSPAPSGPVTIDPSKFSATVDNPWFPLTPGTIFTYHGTKDHKNATDRYAVSNRTEIIDGVACRVVDDRLFLNGFLAERTTDYYTQDSDGNVWYFGEDTAELDRAGHVTSTEGTWHAGVDGAIPGIFMQANPTIGAAFTQEYYPGHAEDHFQVVSLAASISVPYGSFKNALLTKEWTPLEPGVIDHKVYVRGIGEVREVTVKGPLEELVLAKIVKR